jgi:hypothetical protein
VIHANSEKPRQSKLTATQARAIRRAHAEKPRLYRLVGLEYGVTASCIKAIVNRRTWRSI